MQSGSRSRNSQQGLNYADFIEKKINQKTPNLKGSRGLKSHKSSKNHQSSCNKENSKPPRIPRKLTKDPEAEKVEKVAEYYAELATFKREIPKIENEVFPIKLNHCSSSVCTELETMDKSHSNLPKDRKKRITSLKIENQLFPDPKEEFKSFLMCSHKNCDPGCDSKRPKSQKKDLRKDISRTSVSPPGRSASRRSELNKSHKKCKAEKFPFRPLLTKKSIQMASKLGDPNNRLMSSKSVKKSRMEDAVKKKLLEACTFTPKINRKSRFIDERLNDEEEELPTRHEKLYNLRLENKKLEIQKRLEEENRRANIEEINCTFFPARFNTYKGYIVK